MNSLAVRLFLSATIWIILTLFSAGLLLSDLNEKTNFRAFDDRLNLSLETLIGASKIDSSESITVVSTIGDPRYFQPYSGWYWQINDGAKTLARSRSMWDQVFTIDKRLIGGRSQFRSQAQSNNKQIKKIEKKELHIIQREISFPGYRNPVTFFVSGDTKDYKDNIKKFNNTLRTILIVLGVGLMLAVFLQVNFGLLPLNKIKTALFKIRNGDEKKLQDPYPLEVQPLATEINNLLEHNEKILDRAKTHVGNLAHVLKTPLAVVTNELGNDDKILMSQVQLMKKQIDRYLKKAHLDSVGKVTKDKININELSEKMVKIFRKLYSNKDIKIRSSNNMALVLSSLEDMEEVIGNIVENACKWGEKIVIIDINKKSEDEFEMIISDDGPGLPENKMNSVFARGFRLDEQTPGTGLGLNIVKDIVEMCKGSVCLAKSKELGGLEVKIILPLSKA